MGHNVVQASGCMDNEPEPSRGVQFRLEPTKSSAPGRRCDRVSSVYHLSLGKCSNMRPTTRLCPACIPSTTSIHAPTQPTTAMTNYTHTPTVTKSSAFPVQLFLFRDHSQAPVLNQQQQLPHLYQTVLSRADYCNSLLFGSTHDVTPR